MGTSLSAQQKSHANELYKILKQTGYTGVRHSHLEDFVKEIKCQCPWYPEKGSLRNEDWVQIGKKLYEKPHPPIQHLLLWRKCFKAILTLGIGLQTSLLAPVSFPSFPCLTWPALILPMAPPACCATEEAVINVQSLEPKGQPGTIKSTAVARARGTDTLGLKDMGEFLPSPTLVLPAPALQDYSKDISPAVEKTATKGLIKAGIPRVRAEGTLGLGERGELEGDIQTFPMTRDVNNQAVTQLEALPFSVIRELNKAVCESGLHSTYVVDMIKYIGTKYSMAPQDWKDLFRMILSPAQYVVWDMEFRHAAIAASDASEVIPDQIYGAGQFSTIINQAQLPTTFACTAQCILKAFKRVPIENEPTYSFTAILQQNCQKPGKFKKECCSLGGEANKGSGPGGGDSEQPAPMHCNGL